MTVPPKEIAIPAYPMTCASAWVGAEMVRDPKKWLFRLSGEDIEDLELAATHYLGLHKDIGEITKADFPLKHFAAHLVRLRARLIHGGGVEVLRGLPIGKYDRKFLATIFCGIGAHLGRARSQNAQGHILGHVRNIGADSKNPNTRIYQTSERQTFHTDSADVVGLLCIRAARVGGISLVVSATTLYNRMCEQRSDLAAMLFDRIATDRRGEIPEGAKPYMEIPPLSWYRGYLTVFYQRQYIDSAQRFADAMPLSAKHVQALDMFDQLANDPKLHFGVQLKPGDMQFVYNHALLHDRTSFEDLPDPAKQRHLLRLWLSIPGDRPLPDHFKERYGSIEIGNRGGIYTQHTRLHAPLA